MQKMLYYTVYMSNKQLLLFLALIVASGLLPACGPKEIGQGITDYEGDQSGVDTAEMMRYPMTGAVPIQRKLYYANKADIVENVRKWRLGEFNRRLGINPEDPAYREIPKQRSPFKQ